MAEREYLVGDYEEYYSSLSGAGSSSSMVSSFVSQVNNLVTEFNNVKQIMQYWDGEAKSAMTSSTIASIMDKFKTTEANLQEALVPCCEVIDSLANDLALIPSIFNIRRIRRKSQTSDFEHI